MTDMKYTFIIKLTGNLSKAIAVEWTDLTDQDAPVTWSPCHRREDGAWQLLSGADETPRHWRNPVAPGNIAIRYRLSLTGPWSKISQSHKVGQLLPAWAAEDIPPAADATSWSALAALTLEDGTKTGRFTLSGPASAARGVSWSAAAQPQDGDWRPCVALGQGIWHLGDPGAVDLEQTGITLRYRMEPDSPWSPAVQERRKLGAPVIPLPVLPVLISAPLLVGAGRIGEQVSIQPGVWGGTPVPTIRYQWCRDGVEISGATDLAYTPVVADDLTKLTCRVHATNTVGTVRETTAALDVTYAAPQVVADLAPEVFDQNTGLQQVSVTEAFSGRSLRYSVTGAGATVSEQAGLVSIPTDALLDGEEVIVTAQNSGGAASQTLRVSVEPADPGTGEAAYIRAPWHNESKRQANFPPSDNLQVILSFDRSPVNPDLIYAGQDVGGVWLSRDSGRSWNTLRNRGLRTVHAFSVACCPVDEKHVLAVMGSRAPDTGCGIYRTLDGGLNWSKVEDWPSFGEPRTAMHRLAYAPSTAQNGRDKVRWYGVFDTAKSFRSGLVTGKPGLVISRNGGASWDLVRDLPAGTFGSEIYGVRVDPKVADTLYMWGEKGLMRLTNADEANGTLKILSGQGGLPAARVRDLYVSKDGKTLICAAQGIGVFKSTDAGGNWTRLLDWSSVTHVAVNEGHPDKLYAYVRSGNPRKQVKVSSDGGTNWAEPTKVYNFPGIGAAVTMGGNEPYILPDPRNADRATGFADAKWFQTDDGGVTWNLEANAYYCGTHHKGWASPHGFHPSDPEKFVFGMLDTGILTTSNGGVTQRSPRLGKLGLSHLSANGVALHPDGQHIIASVGKFNKGSLIYSEDFGTTWSVSELKETWRQYLGYDAVNPDYAYQYKNISSDKGKTWSDLTMPDAAASIIGVSQSGAGAASAVYVANLGSSRDRIWKSTDRGQSWVLASNVGYNITSPLDVRTTFRIHPKDPHVIFFKGPKAENGASQIRRLDTRTGQHKDFDVFNGATPEADFYADNFAIDGNNPDVMYLRSNSIGTGNYLFMSDDGGANWENISQGFPNVTGGNGLEVHPLTGVVYIGTANGMYVRKPPYAVPTQKNTYDLLRNAYPKWRDSHLEHPF